MRTVYLPRYAPLPLNSGGRLRINAVWRALAAHSDVSLIVVGDKPAWPVRRELYARGGSIFPPRRHLAPARLALAAGLALARGENPMTVRYAWRRRLRRLARRIVALSPDLVVVGDTFLADLVPLIQGRVPRLIIDTHNVESRLPRRVGRESRNPVTKLRCAAEAAYLEGMERRLLPLADQVWAVSDDDARHYREVLGLGNVLVVPNVLDMARYPVPDLPPPDVPTVVFCGWFRHWPNEDAAVKLIAHSRRLAERGLRHDLILVGRDPTPSMAAAAEGAAHVTVTGEVPDVAPYIGGATVFAAPIAAGSGTKLKVLEAMALERAVLTTAVGAEGLHLRSGDQAVIADEGEPFLEALVSLLDDPGRRRDLGLRARAFVQENFSLEVLTATVAREIR